MWAMPLEQVDCCGGVHEKRGSQLAVCAMSSHMHRLPVPKWGKLRCMQWPFLSHYCFVCCALLDASAAGAKPGHAASVQKGIPYWRWAKMRGRCAASLTCLFQARGPAALQIRLLRGAKFLLTQLTRYALACMRAESVSPASWPTCDLYRFCPSCRYFAGYNPV